MIPRVMQTCPACERPFRGHERQRYCGNRHCQSARLATGLRRACGLSEPDPDSRPVAWANRDAELATLIAEQRADDGKNQIGSRAGPERLDSPRFTFVGDGARPWHEYVELSEHSSLVAKAIDRM